MTTVFVHHLTSAEYCAASAWSNLGAPFLIRGEAGATIEAGFGRSLTTEDARDVAKAHDDRGALIDAP